MGVHVTCVQKKKEKVTVVHKRQKERVLRRRRKDVKDRVQVQCKFRQEGWGIRP